MSLEEAGEKWGEPNADRALQPSIGDYNVPTTGLEEEITTTQKPKKTADNAGKISYFGIVVEK